MKKMHGVSGWTLRAVMALAVMMMVGRAAAEPWPQRAAVPGDAAAKGAIHPLRGASSLLGFRTAVRNPTPDDLADARVLLGEGAESAKFEGPGAFVYRVGRPAEGAPAKNAAHGAEYFVFVSATPGEKARVQRTWFALHAPVGDSARGVALLMPGLFGTPPATLDMITRRLRKEGWAVLRMMSQPSGFTAKAAFSVNKVEPEPVMKRIAAEYDDRGAECAYAAEAAMAYVDRGHPEWKGLPQIVVGMSGGAMTLPTVVAREPGRYAAAVLIAGGCDFFTMSLESNYQYLIDAVEFTWPAGLPTDQERVQLAKLYLERAALDSYTTAEALRRKPVLMIHGQFDMAVPAHLGDQLWERLGKPERWVKVAGHEEVFMKLPGEMDRLMGWIGEHVK